MFTRAQLNQLSELSQQAFADGNQWKKLHKDPRLQVFDHYVEIPDLYDYVPTKKPGKFMRVRRKPDGKPTTAIQKPVFRQMNFEELSAALLAVLEMKQFASTYNKENQSPFYELIVRKYRDGTIINRAFLTVPETDKVEFNALFELLPEDQKTVLKPYVVPNQNPQILSVNGIHFVSELIYQNTHQENEVQA